MNIQNKQEKRKFRTIDMAMIAFFAAWIAVCSWISIPAAVPFSLQTFAVFLTIGVLGGRKGTAAVLVYILLGVAGLPVFAGMKGGLGVLFGTTGGYIIGFLCASLLLWGIEAVWKPGRWRLALAMVLGQAVCYLFGSVWFLIVYTQTKEPIGLQTVFAWCVIPFVVPDLLKIALALVVCKRIKSYCKKLEESH